MSWSTLRSWRDHGGSLSLPSTRPRENQTTHPTATSPKHKKGAEDSWGTTSQTASEGPDHLVLPPLSSLAENLPPFPAAGAAPKCLWLGREASYHQAEAGAEDEGVRVLSKPTFLGPQLLGQVRSPAWCRFGLRTQGISLQLYNEPNSANQLQPLSGEKLWDLHTVRCLEPCRVLNLWVLEKFSVPWLWADFISTIT